MLLNSKGQVTIPAALRAKYNLHEGDEVDVIEDDGVLRIVRVEGAETPGQRLVRRMRSSRVSKDVDGMSTDEIMELLRGD
ncbi:AbrB/MazE/SpoVT family DNA-binding domain-containing protein [Streptomyces sp. GC420]|uniref:AbrB/MazE/SpoVT family DNA-binding domain-containing protein n=1 Tax=Streptomyces sp. GC420 TaxID=2697568 RepID=UPI00141523B9|nr:AbrB/MazE/SpoVT family DNA-binding domain-containing protein [Streptomyces sp. GC420]NBM14774.1 AbrB/MazE/SpoVT family DNA-binding domain-containing protein [Streptomyces sp. GC420]